MASPSFLSGALTMVILAAPTSPSAEDLRAQSPEQFIARGREGVRALGAYRARVTKQERVGDKVLPPQTIELLVRPSPPALRLEYVQGPKAGRKVVWTAARPNQMLVREAGLLGVMSVWIDVSGRRAHGDTNHSITEFGFASVLDLMAGDLRKAAPYGGHQRRDQGYDAAGHYCMVFAAPAGATNLYAQRTRLCIDPRRSIPVEIEVHDRAGFLERYRFADVRPNVPAPQTLFEDL